MPGEWHTKVVNLFPKDIQEIKFCYSYKNSNISRRADICLSNIELWKFNTRI